jgi:hypothetical protein
MNSKNKYTAAFVLILLFAVDCLSQHIVTGQAATWEDAYFMASEYVKYREVFIAFMYLCLLLNLRKDLFDKCLIIVFVLSQVVTVWDYENNGNQRETGLDWWAFVAATLIILTIKILFYEWRRLSYFLKTRR